MVALANKFNEAPIEKAKGRLAKLLSGKRFVKKSKILDLDYWYRNHNLQWQQNHDRIPNNVIIKMKKFTQILFQAIHL